MRYLIIYPSSQEQSLFVPLVDKLGYEYKGGEDPDLIQLRTLAIGAAAGADAPEYVDTCVLDYTVIHTSTGLLLS